MTVHGTITGTDRYARGHIIPGSGKHHHDKLTPQYVQAFLNDRTEAGLAARRSASSAPCPPSRGA